MGYPEIPSIKAELKVELTRLKNLTIHQLLKMQQLPSESINYHDINVSIEKISRNFNEIINKL